MTAARSCPSPWRSWSGRTRRPRRHRRQRRHRYQRRPSRRQRRPRSQLRLPRPLLSRVRSCCRAPSCGPARSCSRAPRGRLRPPRDPTPLRARRHSRRRHLMLRRHPSPHRGPRRHQHPRRNLDPPCRPKVLRHPVLLRAAIRAREDRQTRSGWVVIAGTAAPTRRSMSRSPHSAAWATSAGPYPASFSRYLACSSCLPCSRRLSGASLAAGDPAAHRFVWRQRSAPRLRRWMPGVPSDIHRCTHPRHGPRRVNVPNGPKGT